MNKLSQLPTVTQHFLISSPRLLLAKSVNVCSYLDLPCEKSEHSINEELFISLSFAYFPNKHADKKMPNQKWITESQQQISMSTLKNFHCLTKFSTDKQRYPYNTLFPLSEYLRTVAANKFSTLRLILLTFTIRREGVQVIR